MKITPLGDRLVIRADVATNQIGTFYIPEAAKEKPLTGVIVAVGDELQASRVGQRVLFNKYGPTEVNINDEDLLIVKAEDVLVVLE